MSLVSALSAYFNLNLLILIGVLSLGLFSLVLRTWGKRLGASSELRLHYAVLLIMMGFAVAHPFLPRNEVFSPAAKVWSASSIKSFSQEYPTSEMRGYLSLPTPLGASTVQTDRLAMLWIVLSVMTLLLGGFFVGRDLHSLFRIQRRSFLVRQMGTVRVLINDDIQVPFSYWLPGQANVIVPSALLARPDDYKMAIAHELQHHRHGDTRWVYGMWALRLICVINPAIHFWIRWITEIQEFACDETLVDRNKVESQAYARCLVEVAQTAIHQKHVPVCATGLMFWEDRKLLKRRIERMFSKSSTQTEGKIGVLVGLVVTLIMGATAYASKGLVQDRRVSMAQAQDMAIRAQGETGFPVVVNDLVLKQLNRFIGTPEGREFMRDALVRMEDRKAVVGGLLQKYSAPEELLAVPIIESGYRNLDQRHNTSMKAAGMWQFIPNTARIYGLQVDRKKDERLDIPLSTDAAIRYLQSNNLRFKDWHLSALAYNMGESAVQKGMDALNSRDAWTLIRNGHEGDKDYLPRLMAAILIMRNPESVQ